MEQSQAGCNELVRRQAVMMATDIGARAQRLSSMTGFSRGTGRDERYEWVWELKCVNGRGLDIRCRTPSGWDMLEAAARTAASERFTRGNLTMSLQLNPIATTPSVFLNQSLLEPVSYTHLTLPTKA